MIYIQLYIEKYYNSSNSLYFTTKESLEQLLEDMQLCVKSKARNTGYIL